MGKPVQDLKRGIDVRIEIELIHDLRETHEGN